MCSNKNLSHNEKNYTFYFYPFLYYMPMFWKLYQCHIR